MSGYLLKSFSLQISILTLFLAAPEFAAAQAGGPQKVRIPPPAAKAKPKTDRSTLPPIPVFKDIAKEISVTVQHIAAPEARYVIDSTSGGSGLFDCDDDGRLDIVLVNGSTVDRLREGGDPMVTLYHQEPDGTFKDITKEAGLTRLGWGMGVAVADYDNDGKLDLFVAGYTHVDMNNLPEFGSNKYCRYKGVLVQCGPWGLVGESDFLYHNRGDGTFEEVSVKAGVHDEIGYYGLGVIWADYDDDGWPDLLVANDSVPNYLYHNNHDGTFTDEGMLTGLALSGEGMELGNMGVDFGDFDHSGRLGFFVTHFAEQPNSLYRNLGPKGFEDVSWTSGLGHQNYGLVGWGTGFFDMDNDTWLDLFVANGHVFPQVDTVETGARYREPLLLHRNNRDGTFDEVSKEAGLASLPQKCRRGAAFGDIFNTGNVDIVVLNVGETPSLLKNRNADGYHRVLFKLVGTKSNRAAIGARVTIHAAGIKQFSEVRGGGSYLSQNDLRQHFGLGTATKMESVEIRWPSGKIETLQNIAADAIYTIVEGEGVSDTKPLPPPAKGASSGSR